MQPSPEITQLIQAWQRGDRGAENELFEALYRRLHSIALHCLRGEAAGRSLGATELVHQAYIRFRRSEPFTINDRGHFLALAAGVMRRILVDRARARRSAKRDAGAAPPEPAEPWFCSMEEADRILEVDQALKSLYLQSQRQAKLVELRYFAGFDEEESASALGISTRQARRDWQVARTRLRIAIDGTSN